MMSVVGGSIIALWSAKGIFSRTALVFSLSKAAKPPEEDCIDMSQFRPRRKAFSRIWALGSSRWTWRNARRTIAVSSTSG
ncbi:MAG: hypothetical protein M0D55_09630 [Elusimicrobiota bacterium]|nr:MAG: hypothetical protein M0D55_09630 [Elusimicrobiota bacterium]